MYAGDLLVMRGCSRAEKSGAGADGGSGSGTEGDATLSGIGKSSCGFSSEAVRVFGMSASAAEKSGAVGFTRRELCIEVRTKDSISSIYSSVCDLNISSAVGCTLSKPAIASAALMLRSSCPWANTGSCGAGSVCDGMR